MLPPPGNNLGKIKKLDETWPCRSAPYRENSCPRSRPAPVSCGKSLIRWDDCCQLTRQASRPSGLLSWPFVKKCKSKQIVKKFCKPYCTSLQRVVVSTPCEWLDHFTGKVLRFCRNGRARQRRFRLIVAWPLLFARCGHFVF